MKLGTKHLVSARFWKRFVSKLLAVVGSMSIVIGIYNALRPGRLALHPVSVLFSVCSLALLFALIGAWPRIPREQYTTPNTEIHIVVGDLFEQDTDLVIGMADTFDTEIPHVIADTSIQGQFLAKVYSHDKPALDKDLNEALEGTEPVRQFLPEDRKTGKQQVYPLGTVAAVRHQRRHFYCVAYSTMNKDCEARASVDGLWLSLSKVWDEVRRRSNGAPVSIAVIGGGQSRISQQFPAQDSIRFIAFSFICASRKEKVCSRLNIVVQPTEVKKLDMSELGAFLKSLKG